MGVLTLGSIGLVGAAAAQDNGEGVPADSAASSIFRRAALVPSYTTKVDVNRTSTTWSQTFRLDRAANRPEFATAWNVDVKENSAQNDYRGRFGNSKTRLEYSLPRLGGWSTGADLQLKRNFQGSDFDRTVDNGTDANLFVRSRVLGTGLARMMRVNPEKLEWSITGLAGVTNDTDIRQTKVRDGGGALQRSDSTFADGASQALETEFRYSSGGPWNVNVNGRINRSNQDSRTERWQSSFPDSLQILDDENESSGQRWSLSAIWNPNRKTRANVTGQYVRAVDQYYSSVVQEKDTKDGLDQRISLDLSAEPLWGVETGLRVQSTLTDVTYEVGTQDRGKRKNQADATIQFLAGPVFGPLRGTEFTTEVSWEDSKNFFETSTDYDFRERRLRQKIRRPFGPKVVLLATAEQSLGQSYYADGSLDRDELRTLLDGALGYRPTKKLDTRVTAQWQQRQTLNIPAKTSTNSNTQNSYRVGAEVRCKLNPNLEVSQKYSITADYSFYDFNENSNGLVRTTEVRTGLRSTLGASVMLDVDHNYRFKDSGSYVRSTPLEPRAYIRATEENYQYLTVTTGYAFSEGVDIHASQRFETRRTTSLATDPPRVTETERLEFTGGMRFVHDFDDDFGINASIDRTESSVERSYWRMIVALNKVF